MPGSISLLLFFQGGPLQSFFFFFFFLCLFVCFRSVVFSAPSLHPESVRAIPSPTDVPNTNANWLENCVLESVVCGALGHGGFSPCACFWFQSLKTLHLSASGPSGRARRGRKTLSPLEPEAMATSLIEVNVIRRFMKVLLPVGTCESWGGGKTVGSARPSFS